MLKLVLAIADLVRPDYQPEPGDYALPGWFDRPPTPEEFARRLAERHQRVVAYDPRNMLVYVRDKPPC